MKLFITAFILVLALPLYAQDPIVKFYLNNGNQAKEYKIEDISGINFIKSNLSYSMEIFIDGSINAYNVKDINSIELINSIQLKINLSNSSKNISIAQIDSIIFIPNTCTEVVIGTQTWMCKNLDVDHYRNGDPIPQIKDTTKWAKLKTGAWCYYNNDPALGAIYGKLYNWYAVNDSRGLAPEGWHVPSDAEWTTLFTYLRSESIAGGKLKESGTTHWKSPNIGATNETGFSALPGGRLYAGKFSNNVVEGWWWSSTECYMSLAFYRYLKFSSPALFDFYDERENGFSVRCVKN
ncbi:MAG: fibrobacter succinogenes major paralogous domain-containing protein [bacterium]